MSLGGIAAIVFVLGLILAFHESGHFLVAKACRMRVDEFGIGLPVLGRVYGREIRGTVYSLHWLPFGAFVKIAGMEPGEEDVPNGFHKRPIWQRMLVIVAGPAMNIALAVFLLWALGGIYGEPTEYQNAVGKVLKGSAAAQAGLRRGDRILAVNDRWTSTDISAVEEQSPAARAGLRAKDAILRAEDEELTDLGHLLDLLRSDEDGRVKLMVVGEDEGAPREAILAVREPDSLPERLPSSSEPVAVEALGATFEPLQWSNTVALIQVHPREEITITVERDGQRLDVSVTPRPVFEDVPVLQPDGSVDAERRELGRVGISPLIIYRKQSPGESIKMGFQGTYLLVVGVVGELASIVVKREGHKVKSIVYAGKMLAQDAALSWYYVLLHGAIISILIAVFNLLPFPPLDGWRIVYLGYEKIIGRAPDRRRELIINLVGFAAIILLFIWLGLRDVSDLVQNWRLK